MVEAADVAIVGAGPAGSWAAYSLAARGARVMIFDPAHPREKPCGGGVTGRALKLVAPAVPPASLRAVTIARARFVSAEGASAAVPLDGHALVVASRAAFDAELLKAAQRAGAELVARRVSDVSRDAPGWTITTSDGSRYTASFVIGADGANSLIRRRLAHPFGRRQLSIATGFFAHGVTSDEIVIELTGDPPGYLWSFPRPDHLAVGICAQADSGAWPAALRATAAAWIRRTGIAPHARLEPYSWPIPSLSAADIQSLDVSGPGWLLVGDAAGLVDPITREGIFFALSSAAHAADAIGCGTDASARYRQLLGGDVLPELGRAARLRAGFFRPRFTQLMMDALTGSEAIRCVMADLVAGTQSYRGLKRRLLGTFEWRLAWRALSGAT